jgi:N utilization substance protein B
MGKRRKARESTLQILFQLEFNDLQPEKTIQHYWLNRKASKEAKEYSHWLVNGILTHKEKIDSVIQSVSEHWRIARMAVVDRNILRMAVYELLFEENIAPAIIINEAIEIAKKYSSDEAATFVNGILDAIRKKSESDKKAAKEETNE